MSTLYTLTANVAMFVTGAVCDVLVQMSFEDSAEGRLESALSVVACCHERMNVY